MAEKRGRVTLEPYELELFKQPNWLNDSCVEWWIEKMIEETVPAHRQREVYGLSPSAVFLAKSRGWTKEKLTEEFASLELDKKRIVLMPMNDHETVSGEDGGSHWSMLVYERSSNTFRLYDSLKGVKLPFKKQQAQALMKKMSTCLAAADAKFEVETECPQQDNSYDCGAIACMVAGKVVRAYLTNQRKPLAEELSTITSSLTEVSRREALKRAQKDPMFAGIPADRESEENNRMAARKGIGRMLATIAVAFVYWYYVRE